MAVGQVIQGAKVEKDHSQEDLDGHDSWNSWVLVIVETNEDMKIIRSRMLSRSEAKWRDLKEESRRYASFGFLDDEEDLSRFSCWYPVIAWAEQLDFIALSLWKESDMR